MLIVLKHSGGSTIGYILRVGHFARIDGITNPEKCRRVLIHHPILQSGKPLIGNGFIFKHNNAVKADVDKNTVETLSIIAWHLSMRVRVVFILFTTFHPLGRCTANEINLFFLPH